ncbi:MAG TPA: hypothetical protein PKD96_02270 [Candidatus Absconditabacterales bacterium]|nr:hypothetical protein [Candidatus Absconditabacterales bacterium]
MKIKYLKKIEKICKVLHDKYGKHIELILVLDILDKQGTSGVIIDKESLAFIHRMGAEIDIIN